jgi:hypothetical protein
MQLFNSLILLVYRTDRGWRRHPWRRHPCKTLPDVNTVSCVGILDGICDVVASSSSAEVQGKWFNEYYDRSGKLILLTDDLLTVLYLALSPNENMPGIYADEFAEYAASQYLQIPLHLITRDHREMVLDRLVDHSGSWSHDKAHGSRQRNGTSHSQSGHYLANSREIGP